MYAVYLAQFDSDSDDESLGNSSLADISCTIHQGPTNN
jgi:hypothetical protein